MKKGNILTMNQLEPVIKQISLSTANLLSLVLIALVMTGIVVSLQVKQDTQLSGTKSVAWYTANQKEAREQNKACFENPAIQQSDACRNSLHALEMSYKGINS